MSLPPFTPAPPTEEKLDYVKLVNLDLSKFDTQIGRQELAKDLYEAATGYGFLTLSNHGISDEVYAHQMQIANAMMTLSAEEKAPYEGIYSYFIGLRYKNVAIILEVPEEVMQSTHAPGGSKTEYIRYMMCEPRSKEESEKYRDIFLSGHTDLGTWTFLFSQPIAALQVLDHNDGKYRWVEHQPHGLVVNFGDALARLTGGLFKATIHRVVQPPEDQRHLRRIGVIYFSRPADERELVPIEGSPLLQRLGRDKPIDEQVFCMADFLDARKHGFKRYEYDLDRPRDTQKHADFFAGEYPDPEGHQSLGKFDNVPREVYVPSLKAS
ncbi:uncharacterized protein CLUP02_05026 [Colletotrichum lupini]|uniref:Uncharacterized protein n=1 Tax=Colletotrichum lupini TaxID=145971 RepID=A0A9Q8SLG1_9PEZI|nr:uncharacterized protein CLUP02_05026 [Colletotrichum lupini]UQC79546.1 hypothetical protein CLUP02_05026 [Colletotrichum lupini]